MRCRFVGSGRAKWSHTDPSDLSVPLRLECELTGRDSLAEAGWRASGLTSAAARERTPQARAGGRGPQSTVWASDSVAHVGRKFDTIYWDIGLQTRSDGGW